MVEVLWSRVHYRKCRFFPLVLTSVFATFVLIFPVTYGRVLLYNIENEQTVEKFDCVYYMSNDGEEISYCRRPGGSERLHRNRNECDNQGEEKRFRDLLDQEIDPSNVLKLSSSVEVADIYASIFYNRSLINDHDDRFVRKFYKQPRPVSTLLKGLIRWLVHIHLLFNIRVE